MKQQLQQTFQNRYEKMHGECDEKTLKILTVINEMEVVCYKHGLNQQSMPYGMTDTKSLSEIFNFSNGAPPQEVIKCLECMVKILKSAYAQGKIAAEQKKAPSTTPMAREQL